MARFAVVLLPVIASIAVATHAAQSPAALPASLEDQEFWQLVVDLSEPDGFFEDENYVSNELGYQRVMGRLQERVEPGGVFVGVGPEQNFSYVAALRPAMAFVIDIRRQNMVQLLMYKALFELSPDRADFVSRLFSRPRPPGLDTASDVDALFQAYAPVSDDGRLFDDSQARVLEVLIDGHGFELDADDRASLTKILTAFREGGPELMYVFRGTPERHPTYGEMMTAADADGRHWSYLATEESFQHVPDMHEKNLIVPVVGDFAGPKALRAVGAYVRARGATIDVFYTSNVETYLFANGTWGAFYENLATLPLDGEGLFVRTFFGAIMRECAALRPTIRTPVLGSLTALMTTYRAGELTSPCDLVSLSRKQSRP
jgi:hypothetical protein